jgi:hypothetical protein
LKARGKAANSRREIVFKDPWRRAASSRKPARARTGSGKTAELPPECGCFHVFASAIFSPDDQPNTNGLANPPRLKQERDRRVPRSESLAVRLAMLHRHSVKPLFSAIETDSGREAVIRCRSLPMSAARPRTRRGPKLLSRKWRAPSEGPVQ